MKYEKCLSCGQLGISCDGPNFVTMDPPELGQWCNMKRKTMPGMTFDKISAETGISKSAVHSFLNGTKGDYRLDTIRPILKMITGGKWDDNPCGNLSNSEKAQYEENERRFENEIRWRDDKIQHIISENETLKQRIDNGDKLMRERYDFLKRKDRIIRALLIVIGVLLAIIIAAFIADMLNKNVGFFWVQ